MSLQLKTGWDFAAIGQCDLKVRDSAGSGTVSFTSGLYCHDDLQSVLGSGNYDDFSTILASQLNALSSPAGTFTVSWSDTTYYTISYSGGTGNLVLIFTTPGAAGTRMRQVLGFTGNSAAAASHTSNATPYYCFDCTQGAPGLATDDYEPEDVAKEGELDDGTHFGVARTSSPKYNDFTIQFETREKTYKRDASSTVPWTLEHLFEHCRNVEPIKVDDGGTDDRVVFLRAEGASFKPVPIYDDYLALLNIRMLTRVYGRT